MGARGGQSSNLASTFFLKDWPGKSMMEKEGKENEKRTKEK